MNPCDITDHLWKYSGLKDDNQMGQAGKVLPKKYERFRKSLAILLKKYEPWL